MIYELNLNLPIGCFRKIDEIKRKLIKEKLESITGFEKRLSYYNNEIRSLSTYEKQAAQIYYEWGFPDQTLKVFCTCNNCRSNPDFDVSLERVYHKIRTKEIKRLITGIKNQNTYKDQLFFLFNTKGYNPDLTPAVWVSHNEEPIIDLRPETKEEIRILNEFVIERFESKYRNGKAFTPAYNGFDLEKERQRLNERLQQPATDKPVLLQYIKAEIEKHFSYPESLHTDKREKHISSHVLQQIDRQLKDMGHIDKLFERMNFGEKIDLLSVTGLDSNSLLYYTHVCEIFRFYQYVKEVIKSPDSVTSSLVSESIQNLFRFIDFLHSKTSYFLSKEALINKVMELHNKRNSLKPSQNFKDRIEYNRVQAAFEKEFEVLKKETTIIIIEKIHELNIADISTPIINLNAHGDLFDLQRNFSEKDLPKIFEAKRKYLEFRTKTNFHYFLEFFFYDLDRDLKEFFDYFKETTENEFEAFETKNIQVKSIGEAVELLQRGHKQFTLPIDFLTPSKVQQNNNEALPPQQYKTQTEHFNNENNLQFHREFEKADIPFKYIIDKEPSFKTELFNQYCNAEKKPCFDLYLAEYYTHDEIKKGFEEIHKQIPVSNSKEIVAASFVAQTPFESRINELHNQFVESDIKKELAAKYYCPDIEKTAIVQALKAISNEYELLKKSVFDEKTDKYKEAEIRSKNVVAFSERLKDFAIPILEQLQQDNENINLHIAKADNTKFHFWQTLKSNFNNAMLVQEQATCFGTNKRETAPEFSYQIKKETVNNLSKQEIETILSEIKTSENKFWKGLPMEQVVKHFEVMTTRKNKNGYYYLTTEQLIKFLKKGFLNDIGLPKQKINCYKGEKGFVIKRFYEFFDLAVSQYSYPPRKERFISLFTDCFDNWEPNTIEPFFKPNKTKEKW